MSKIMDFWMSLLGIKGPEPVVEVKPEPLPEVKPEPKPKAARKPKAKSEPKVEKPDFTKMSKAELIDCARTVGIELNMKMKKDEMVSKLNA